MKAVKKFKNFLSVKRPEIMEDILGGHARIVQPPLSMLSPDASPIQHRARSVDSHDRRPIEQVLVAEGVHRDINLEGLSPAPTPPTETNDKQTEKKSQGPSHHPKGATHPGPSTHTSTSSSHRAVSGSTDHGKGHAHDPLSDQLFLSIGPGLGESSPSPSSTPPDPPIVSESPPAADIDIYETAYHNEVERIRQMQGRRATLYLTRRIEAGGKVGAGLAVGAGGLSRLLEMAREKGNKGENENENENGNGKDEKKVEDSEQGCEQPAGPGGLARILEMAREQGKKGEKRKDDEKANDQPA